jgi:hypothetical protein
VMRGMDSLIPQEMCTIYVQEIGLICEFIFLEWYNSVVSHCDLL